MKQKTWLTIKSNSYPERRPTAICHCFVASPRNILPIFLYFFPNLMASRSRVSFIRLYTGFEGKNEASLLSMLLVTEIHFEV